MVAVGDPCFFLSMTAVGCVACSCTLCCYQRICYRICHRNSLRIHNTYSSHTAPHTTPPMIHEIQRTKDFIIIYNPSDSYQIGVDVKASQTMRNIIDLKK